MSPCCCLHRRRKLAGITGSARVAEARALNEAGYHVSVISPKGPGFERSYEILDGIELYRYPNWESNGTVLGYIVEYGWALIAEFLLAFRIYSRTRFRVLQACNPPDSIFLIALFFKLFGVRFIFDYHDPNPELFVFEVFLPGVSFTGLSALPSV